MAHTRMIHMKQNCIEPLKTSCCGSMKTELFPRLGKYTREKPSRTGAGMCMVFSAVYCPLSSPSACHPQGGGLPCRWHNSSNKCIVSKVHILWLHFASICFNIVPCENIVCFQISCDAINFQWRSFPAGAPLPWLLAWCYREAQAGHCFQRYHQTGILTL